MTDKLPEEAAAESHVEGVGGVQFAEEVNMTDTPEFKPCPFCGIVPGIWERVHDEDFVAHPGLICDPCPLSGQQFGVSVWNKRIEDLTPAPEPAKDVEGLIDALAASVSVANNRPFRSITAETLAAQTIKHELERRGYKITALQSQASADQIIAELTEVLDFYANEFVDGVANGMEARAAIAVTQAKAWREAG